MEKFLYFRTEAALADDDDIATSYCRNVKDIVGFVPGSDTLLGIMFKPFYPVASDGQDGNFSNTDQFGINIKDNTHYTVIKAIVDEIAYGRNPLIVVADDCTDDDIVAADARYLHPCIVSCGNLTVNSSFS